MAWAKIDDQFYMSLKNARMDRDEQDLYLAGIVYCNGQLTDGFIPASKLTLLCAWAKIPSEANAEANAQAIASRLVEHEYWELVDGGYVVHDFLDWNMSRAEVLALRKTRSEAGKRGGKASRVAREASAVANGEANAVALGQAKSNPITNTNTFINDEEEGAGVGVPAGVEDNAPPDVRAIRNAYEACGIMLTPAHLGEHQESIKKWGLSAWQTGFARALEAGKHNMVNYVLRCVESAALEEQQKLRKGGNNGSTKNAQRGPVNALAAIKAAESRPYHNPTDDELAAQQAEWDADMAAHRASFTRGREAVPGVQG